MKRDALGRTIRLIQDNELHENGAPVDLRMLHDTFVPELVDLAVMAGVPALAIAPDDGRVSLSRPALVYLDVRDTKQDQRLNYAHEIGHVLCGHGASLPSLELGDWWYDKDEREAWEAASRLLIPWTAISSGHTTSEIAMICEVPEWLVEMYPR